MKTVCIARKIQFHKALLINLFQSGVSTRSFIRNSVKLGKVVLQFEAFSVCWKPVTDCSLLYCPSTFKILSLFFQCKR